MLCDKLKGGANQKGLLSHENGMFSRVEIPTKAKNLWVNLKPKRREHTVDLDPQINEPRLELGKDLRSVPLQDEKHTMNLGTSLTCQDDPPNIEEKFRSF